MFAIVRTGGKQYRVTEGDVIAIEKITGGAGDAVAFDDVLMAGEGDSLKDTKDLKVNAEILEQSRGEKVIVFKKRRRQNYRRRNGHRQYLTTLRITGIGDKAKQAAPKKAEAKTDDTKAKAPLTEAKAAPAEKAPAKKAPTKNAATSKGAETKAPAKKAPAKKAAAKKTDDKDA